MNTDPKKLIKAHQKLNHSEMKTVLSHTQREEGDWFLNSIMISDCDVPFKFRRKTKYKKINKDQRVNLTYYPKSELVSGLEFEVMQVVRIKLS